jgi:hypothetical protein
MHLLPDLVNLERKNLRIQTGYVVLGMGRTGKLLLAALRALEQNIVSALTDANPVAKLGTATANW